VSELGPEFVDTRALSMPSVAVPSDTLGLNVYDPLAGPKEKINSKL
jgi:L-lactate dehydrogenase (cytochrome)